MKAGVIISHEMDLKKRRFTLLVGASIAPLKRADVLVDSSSGS
jgi:hypothetical protein